ncbi:hypothetical protein D3C80_1963500 [compost metagenome]
MSVDAEWGRRQSGRQTKGICYSTTDVVGLQLRGAESLTRGVVVCRVLERVFNVCRWGGLCSIAC